MSAVVLALAFSALPAVAVASSNNGPSKATVIEVGKPFTGVWPGTVYQFGNSFNHWWRLPAVLRPGDTVQLAVDNRLSDRSVYFCLVPPVDDFGADAAINQCSDEDPSFSPGQQSRATLTYEGSSGQAYLVSWVWLGCCGYDRGDADEDPDGQYTANVEQITSLVNIGMAIPASLPTSFTLTASVLYGDNTPVVDGVPATLQWRPVAPRGSDPVPFSNLVSSTSVGGVVTFAGAMPAAAEGQKVQLRACVAQPGSAEVRCAASGRSLVARSPCSIALENQLRLVRNVKRLALRVRNHRGGPAKLRLKRKLKAKRHKLAKANGSVKLYCG